MKHQCLVDNMKVFHTLLLYSRMFPFISVTIQADWKVIGISDWIFKKCPKLLIADHYTYTLVLPRNTKQNMAIDGQVCFHRWLFANPVKPPRRATGSMDPVNDINKDVSDARLQPTTVLSYPVDRICFCHLLKTQHCCLYPNGRYNLPLATHLPQPPISPLPTCPTPINYHPW